MSKYFRLHEHLIDQNWTMLYVPNACTCKYHPVDMSIIRFGKNSRDVIYKIFEEVMHDPMPEVVNKVYQYLKNVRYPSSNFLNFLISPFVADLPRNMIVTYIFEYLIHKQSQGGEFCSLHGLLSSQEQ